MKEILTMGDVSKEFERLGVVLRETYKGNDYSVCEVTDEEFEAICNDNDNIEGTWSNCAIRYSEGSNQGKPNDVLKINHKDIKCWFNPIIDCNELEKDEEIYKPEYVSLLEYLCNGMGCCLPRNVCDLAVDLAKYNNMKLSELFKEYEK